MNELEQWLAASEAHARACIETQRINTLRRDAQQQAQATWQALLATGRYTIAELDAAYNARCAGIVGHEVERPAQKRGAR